MDTMKKKNPAAVALGRRGGLKKTSKKKGLAALSTEQRSAISRLGVTARKQAKESAKIILDNH
jgi:hypothetical protein